MCDKLRIAIAHYLKYYGNLLLNLHDTQLVHGDFDPANILVTKCEDSWQLSGVLDWEFAFSGSNLWDVANMLRYAHHMPLAYEQAFVTGLEHGGVTLPENWHISVHLLNLIALLDLLARTNPTESPKRCVDIQTLLEHIITTLDKIT